MRESKMLGVVFSNMHDSSLGEMTINRTMGSVPVAGRYRLIDFALSNMVNAGIGNIGVITKSNYQSLMDHLGSGREWDLSRKIGGLVILPPFSNTESGIYRGSIEALNGIMPYLRHSTAQYVVLSDCDFVANIDLKNVLEHHIADGSDITVVYKKQAMHENSRDFTAFSIDSDGRVYDVKIDPVEAGEYNMYVNLAIVDRELLIRLVAEAYSHRNYSFTQDILQAKVKDLKIDAYHLEGYCSRIQNIQGYFAASMEMLQPEVRAQLFPRSHPIYTKVRDEVPAKYGFKSHVSNSLVADGCIIEGHVENSVIFRGVKIGRGAVVKNSVVMQGSTIGENATLEHIITDKNVLVKTGRKLSGAQSYPVYLPKGIIV